MDSPSFLILATINKRRGMGSKNSILIYLRRNSIQLKASTILSGIREIKYMIGTKGSTKNLCSSAFKILVSIKLMKYINVLIKENTIKIQKIIISASCLSTKAPGISMICIKVITGHICCFVPTDPSTLTVIIVKMTFIIPVKVIAIKLTRLAFLRSLTRGPTSKISSIAYR